MKIAKNRQSSQPLDTASGPTPKILHLIGQLVRGGAERQLVLVSRALQERNWRQSVVTFNPGDPWETAFHSSRIPLHRLSRHRLKPWRLFLLIRTLLRERPDIIHSWSLHTNLYASYLPKALRPRLIMSLRGNPCIHQTTAEPLASVQFLTRLCKSDGLISNSRTALEVVSERNVQLPRTFVVGNIVQGRGGACPGETIAVPRIAAAGDLISLKGFDILIRALGRMRTKGKPFDLVLMGKGPEQNSLTALVQQCGITDLVRFLGSVEDVPAEMRKTHLLVHPSRSEGLSNTVLEGMAEGLPVIVTKVGAISEIVEDGKSGFLVNPGNEEDLVKALERLHEDHGLRAKMGAAGLAFVRSNCSVERVVEQYESFYRSIMLGNNSNSVPEAKINLC